MNNKNVFKKVISLLVALVICIGLVPMSVFAEDGTYAITFNANGGTGKIAAKTATAGVEFTLPASTGFNAPSGQRFKAWDINGTEYFPGDKYIFTADTELKAVWQNQTGILKVVTSGDVIKTVEPGGLALRDRGDKFFTDKLEWLKGQEFLWSTMASRVYAETAKEGYVYVFTAPAGNNTVLDELGPKGFVHLTTYGTNEITTGFQPNSVAVKHVMPGEKFDFYWWGFLVASETPLPVNVTVMQNIASVAVGNNEAGGTTAKGGKIFADSDETFSTSLPAILAGKNYIVGSKESGVDVTAATENTLYFLTPASGENSQAEALEAQGCAFLKTFAGNEISSALTADDKITLYTKYVKPGDKVETDGWCVALAKKVSTYKITYDANGGSGSMADGIVVEGGSLTLPENGFTAPDGMEFDAWEVNGSAYAAGQVIDVKADTTVKAIWKEIVVEKVITPSENQSLETVVIGREIYNEEGAVFASTVPEWLIGQNYIRASNAADIETVATADGWVYVLTYADGVEGSLEADLEADGFVNVSKIASGRVSTALNAGEMAVMAKQVSNGDAITVGAGGIIVTSFVMFDAPVTLEAFAEVTPSNDEGADRAVSGYKVFSDGDLAFGETIPTWLAPAHNTNVDFIIGSETNGISATVRTAGKVYFITPLNGEKSQVAALRNAGFEVTGLFNGETVFANDNTVYCVMGKSVEVGETVSCDGFGILLAPKFLEMGELATIIPTFGIPDVIEVGKSIYADQTFKFGALTPGEFIGKEYIYNSRGGYGSGGEVTKSGKIYVATPLGHSNTAEPELRSLGFKYVKRLPYYALGTSLYSVLYEKDFEVGDVLRLSKFNFMMAKSDEEYAKKPYAEGRDRALDPPVVVYNPDETTVGDYGDAGDYLDGNRNWGGIPSIAKDNKTGKLWATWYSGGNTEDEYNFCMLYTSDDDGETWRGPKVVVDPTHYVRAFDPNLWVDPNGRMWFIWNQSYGYIDHRIGVWVMYTDNPGDENPTWSQPYRIANGIAMCDPIVLTQDAGGDAKAGDWILPTSIWNGTGQPEFSSNCYISKDQGMTWTLQGGITDWGNATRQIDEPMIIQQNDGSLTMYIRTANKDTAVWKSNSTDGGKTWSTVVDAGITYISSRFYVARLKSGNLMMVHNIPPRTGMARTYMTAMISTDDGATWPHRLVLREAGGSYPDAYEDDKGNIYVTQDSDRAKGMIWMHKFTEADIMAGEIVTEGSAFNMLVNDNTAKLINVAVTESGDNWNFTVTDTAKIKSGHVYIGAYDGEGRLVDAVFADYPSSEAITMPKNDAVEFRAYIWNGEMTPIIKQKDF